MEYRVSLRLKIFISVFVLLFTFGSGFILQSFLSQKPAPAHTSPPTDTTPLPRSEQTILPGTPSATSSVLGSDRTKVRVVKVIDGDTVEIEGGQKIRYIGVDTPETVKPNTPVQCFGREASARNKELVEGKEIEIETDVSETDRYGRLLRYVYVGDVFVNQVLVSDGYAYASSYPPDVKYQDVFREAQKIAQDSKRGLWGSCEVTSNKAASPTVVPVLGAQTVSMPVSTLSPATTPFPSSSTVAPLVESTQARSQTAECLIKGNISSSGKIYHLPGCGSYEKTTINETQGERWFCTEQEAETAGWRKAKNC